MPTFTPAVYMLLGLTALVGFLAGVLALALLRIVGAARDSGKHLRESNVETALLSAALQEAVTKLREQERTTLARAEASERLNEQIVNGLTSGLLVAGADGMVRVLNPAGHRILGVAPRPLPAPLGDVLENVPALATLVKEAARGGHRAVSRRHIATTGVGGPAHLGVTLSALAGSRQGEEGVICLFTDLSRVVALEEQLRLKDALARLGELTAGLAHEFRNGLATIHGYARLLEPAALPAPHATYAEGLRAETHALGEVVTNFLNFARPERVTFVPLDLEAVIARAAADASPDADVVSIVGVFGEVEGDEVLLRQAFSNLVRNALEACRGAGITPRIEIMGSVAVDDGVVDVRVSDNGPGLPEGDVERLFQPFFTTRADGTGLGLALVQKFIVTHNGLVTAVNRAGGATFVVRLPARGRLSTDG